LTTIKYINIIVLTFPVAHHISGWRPVTRTHHLIVFLLTDSGFIGVGEGTPYGSSITETYAKALSLAKAIQGLTLEDALNTLISKEYEEFERSNQVNYGAYLTLESAVIHALSQFRRARYEAEVLGGVYRTEIPVAYTIFLNHPKTMARKLESAIKLGFKHVKFKIPCSLEELEKQLQILYSTRKQYDEEEVILRADANECFSMLKKAEKALSIMERHGVNIVEQPMPRHMLKDIAKLRKKFHSIIEIMLDESLRKPSDIEIFAQLEVADAINFHPSKLGCLTITREAILKARRLGMKANIGSALMTEIGLTHYLNLAASIPHLDYPLEEMGLNNLYGYTLFPQAFPGIEKGVIPFHNISIRDLDFSMMEKFMINGRTLFSERLKSIVAKAYILLKRTYRKPSGY